MFIKQEIIKHFSELLEIVEEKKKAFSEVCKTGDELAVNIKVLSDVKVGETEGGGETHYANQYLSLHFSKPFYHNIEVAPIDERNLKIVKLALASLADEAIEKAKNVSNTSKP